MLKIVYAIYACQILPMYTHMYDKYKSMPEDIDVY